jgi:hypothetical protein
MLVAELGARRRPDGELELEVELEDARRVRVEVAKVSALGTPTPWVRLLVVLGAQHGLRAVELLENNGRMAVGAFCTHDGLAALRQLLPLAAADPTVLVESIRELALLGAWVCDRIVEQGWPLEPWSVPGGRARSGQR